MNRKLGSDWCQKCHLQLRANCRLKLVTLVDTTPEGQVFISITRALIGISPLQALAMHALVIATTYISLTDAVLVSPDPDLGKLINGDRMGFEAGVCIDGIDIVEEKGREARGQCCIVVLDGQR